MLTISQVANILNCAVEDVEEIATKAGWKWEKNPVGRRTRLLIYVTAEVVKDYRTKQKYMRAAEPFSSLKSKEASIRAVGAFNSIWKRRKRDERSRQEADRRQPLQS